MVAIRRATAADAATLADLRYAFRSSLRPPAEARGPFLERCTQWMAQRLSNSSWLCWVAEVDGVVAGHIWLDIMEKIPNPGPEDELHGYITNLYVQDALRNQGIGAQLLEAALEHCRTHHVDSVILWPTTKSRPLYERHGFEPASNVMIAVTGVNASRLAARPVAETR